MATAVRHHRLSAISFLPDRVLDQIDVDPDSEHLFWTGGTTLNGYPRLWDGERLVMLSRWIATEVHGEPPTPQHQAGHVCHDQEIHACHAVLTDFDFHRLCCNPEHIAWQTPRENILASARAIARINRDQAEQKAKARDLANMISMLTPWWKLMSDEDKQIHAMYADAWSLDDER